MKPRIIKATNAELNFCSAKFVADFTLPENDVWFVSEFELSYWDSFSRDISLSCPQINLYSLNHRLSRVFSFLESGCLYGARCFFRQRTIYSRLEDARQAWKYIIRERHFHPLISRFAPEANSPLQAAGRNRRNEARLYRWHLERPNK